ncbi:MAG: sigma 54-interacting transcriptional regulator [Clostridiales Family XIII bacterium]|jgi:transcriptional regulator with PAS, ATPase and Fis domain|nr:sigma 54-interacting transcriptional regulator [Clostridiales Family XIII bacterium]
MNNCLQYVYFVNADDRLTSCDADSQEFLDSVSIEDFTEAFRSLRMNFANTSSTILLENTSYTMHVIPIEEVERKPGTKLPKGLDEGFLIVLHDQQRLSAAIHELGMALPARAYEDVFEDFDTAIYITRADGVSLFINSKYEELTGIRRGPAIGKSVYDLSGSGLYMPLVSPAVLETRREHTVFQSFSSKTSAVITGIPIFGANGEPYCVLICVNRIDHKELRQLSRSLTTGARGGGATGATGAGSRKIDIIAVSDAMREAIQQIVKAAHYDVPILLLGESGTGKEVLASVLHYASNRRAGPYLQINCSAIPPALLESELFGYEAGAFTGALAKGKPGLLEAADEGTLLLDEIGDIPLEFQAKLLRLLQNKEYYRVGSVQPMQAQTRIIAATNRDLPGMVGQGLFRQDLYYRLNVIAITIPPLRERREDIRPLLLHFCHTCNQKYGMNKRLSDGFVRAALSYGWPGNVRELQNLVERLVIMSVQDEITEADFARICPASGAAPENEAPGIAVSGIPNLPRAVAELERIIIGRALAQEKSTRKAAALIGISQPTLVRKMKE